MQFSFSPKNRHVKRSVYKTKNGKMGARPKWPCNWTLLSYFGFEGLADNHNFAHCQDKSITTPKLRGTLQEGKWMMVGEGFERREIANIWPRSSTTKLNTTHFLPISHSQDGQKNDDDVS